MLDIWTELTKSRDADIHIMMAPIEDDIPLGWYLSSRSANSLSWQLSTKSNSPCILNRKDTVLASCALKRLQYLVNPQGADVQRVSASLADWLLGYDGIQRKSCE